MARLTPLAKGLITITILGGAAAAVWHLGLKDMLGKGDGDTSTQEEASSGGMFGSRDEGGDSGSSSAVGSASSSSSSPKTTSKGSGPLGSSGNP